ELEEAYSQFILSIGGKPSRRRSRPRNPARRNSRRHLPSAEPAENPTSAAGSSSSAPSAGEPLTKRYDPVEASRLQKLFRANQKKALQSILSGPPRYCEISPDAVEDHFVRVFSENPFDPTFKFLTYDDPVACHLITDHMSPEEVWDKLRALKNSAPGPDGIFYSNFKSRDPGAHVLSAFFNKVLDLSTVPSSWKEAKVVLIPKPGDPLDISNWRPVSLLNTGGKVFSSVLAARISSWANINSRLSPFQKGFRENDGCSEHNFILEQAITGAKRLHLDLSMAWLDLENAFGSVPHRFILEALGHAGVPSSTVAIISAIYTGSTSTIRTSAGWTGPIPMRAGVRQGCPLSAILFNLSLEQILKTGISAPGFRLYGQEVKCLAYADDLLLLGQSPVDLQDNINSICGVAALAGLRFKPSKCASLSFNYTGNKRSIDDASFLVAGTPIRNINDQEAYKYLGVRKLTAIRAHVLSRAEFLCRNSHIQKRDVADLDKTLISTGKRILNLPTRANVNLVHLSTNKGGAALPHFRALLDVHAISHAFRLLASDDQLTSDVAFAGLRGVVRKKILRDPTPSECAEFLNGNKAGDFARDSGDHSTLWSRARQAADRLFNFIKFSWTFNEELGCFNLNIYRSPNPVCVVPSTAGLVARLLRDDLESFYIKQLSSLVDQGKTVEVFSQHPASNHFLQAGDFTRFCDWNFIHRARLGCLQLNATMRFSKRNPKCQQILRTGISAPGFRLYGQEVKCLAYADDLLLLGQSPVDLQDNIDSICSVAALAGLRFKPSKCASLSFNYTGNRRSIDDASFLVAGTHIRNIQGQEAYKYLGVRVGLNYKQDNTEFFRGITRDVKLVAASPLAPWQKLTAIRAHVLARAEFLCRNSHIQKRDVADLDKTLISTGKRILNLPTRANVNLVHLSTNKGGAALPHFRALLDVHSISHAFRLLASDDPLTSDVAFAGLRGVVRKKILRDPTPSECAEFLNGNKAGDFARESGDLSTLWSRARQAADRLFKFIKFSWTFNEELGCFHLNIFRSPKPVCVVPSTAGLVARLLRDDLESYYIKQLSSPPSKNSTSPPSLSWSRLTSLRLVNHFLILSFLCLNLLT
ncbi:retrovirus-related Pol polyprotein from type-1 retrotransposable element R2, partial [Nephila pilipes]